MQTQTQATQATSITASHDDGWLCVHCDEHIGNSRYDQSGWAFALALPSHYSQQFEVRGSARITQDQRGVLVESKHAVQVRCGTCRKKTTWWPHHRKQTTAS